MGETEVRSFLAGGRVLVLVTMGPDGMPDPVPMWFVVDDATGEPLMRTYAKSQKVVNLRRDPRAVGLVEDGDRYLDLRGVQLTGRIDIIEDPDVVADVVARLAVKYEGVAPEHLPAVKEAALTRAGKQVAMRLVADRVVSWDHRKLAPVPDG